MNQNTTTSTTHPNFYSIIDQAKVEARKRGSRCLLLDEYVVFDTCLQGQSEFTIAMMPCDDPCDDYFLVKHLTEKNAFTERSVENVLAFSGCFYRKGSTAMFHTKEQAMEFVNWYLSQN